MGKEVERKFIVVQEEGYNGYISAMTARQAEDRIAELLDDSVEESEIKCFEVIGIVEFERKAVLKETIKIN